MKKKLVLIILLFVEIFFISCNQEIKKEKKEKKIKLENTIGMMQTNDKRISLKLNSMQKEHQLKNMRSHLETVQQIVMLLSNDDYDKASEIAYTKLGSTTEMKLMCSSFGDKGFENLGLEFHKSADKMSEIFKNSNKKESLIALSDTMNYCIQCHSNYRQ